MSLSAAALRRRNAAGYALLEALIAIIVAAVGFIGAARMQTFGMKLSSSAQSRQKASLLAYQMTDRIRANQTGFENGNYIGQGANGSVACLSSGCTPAELATADVAQWLADVAAQLPEGQGMVCFDSNIDDPPKPAANDWQCDGVPNVIAVKVQWRDRVGDERTRFVTVVRP